LQVLEDSIFPHLQVWGVRQRAGSGQALLAAVREVIPALCEGGWQVALLELLMPWSC
jgi:hypothetical protein